MLEPLGISAETEALYVTLASVTSASVDQLVASTGIPVGMVEHRLANLADLGLSFGMGDGLWRALPIVEVAKGLRDQRIAEIEAATIAAESLQNHLLAASQTQEDGIEVIIGRESIVAKNWELCEQAAKEICFFDKPPYLRTTASTEEDLEEVAPEWLALRRGVALRSIYHPGFDNERLKYLILYATRGEQSRTGPVPMKLGLFDRHTALIPSMPSYMPGHESRVSLVRHPLIVESLQWLFEAVWDTAIPVTASTYTESDPRRQMLVSLMMSGSTDDAIANQLGINVRSVRRWIAELMDELGVTTRLQLGAALVRAENRRSGSR